MDLNLSTTLGEESFSTSGDETAGRIAIDVENLSQKDLPLDIVFCVDASGSMSGSKINNATSGIEESLKHLSSEDSFAVVSFDNSATVEVGQTSGDNWRSTTSEISSIQSGGGTNIIAGLGKSKDELGSMSSSSIGNRLLGGSGNNDRIQWIVLLTDGRPGSNVSDALKGVFSSLTGSSLGSTLAEKHGSVAENLSDEGITIHTAGVGNYDKDVVQAISERSQGEWNHCSSSREVAEFFKRQADSAESVVATDPRLRIESRNGAKFTDFYQSVPQSSDANISQERNGFVADAPDISGDTPPEFTFEMTLPSHERDPSVTVGEATLEVGSESVSEEIIVGFSDMSLGETNEEVYEEHAITKASVNAGENPEEASKAIQKAKEEIGETETLNEVEEKVGIVARDTSSDAGRSAEEDVSRAIKRKRED